METSESSNPTTVQGASGTGVDSISSIFQFVTEFSANAQLFGLAAMWIKEASQKLAEIQLIAVQHEILIVVLYDLQNTTIELIRKEKKCLLLSILASIGSAKV